MCKFRHLFHLRCHHSYLKRFNVNVCVFCCEFHVKLFSCFLTWYDFIEAVLVAEVVVALKLLWPLTQGPALHVCFIILHESLFKQTYGSFMVAFIIQFHCNREGALWQRRDRRSWERTMMGPAWPSLCSLWFSDICWHFYVSKPVTSSLLLLKTLCRLGFQQQQYLFEINERGGWLCRNGWQNGFSLINRYKVKHNNPEFK